MKYSRIIGTGAYLPEKILSNADLEKMVDTSDQWIVERTGIRARRLAAEGQGTADLAAQAARAALESAHLSANALDLIIVATTTPDQIFPSTACLVQARLGNKGAVAFDVQAACTGFVYGLAIADKFIKTQNARHALVIGAEVFSRLVDWQDRNTCILFGDGAGAVVLNAAAKPGIRSTHLYADGSYAPLLNAPGYISSGGLQAGDGYTKMQGSEVFKFAVNAMSEAIETALHANELEKTDIDWLVPHQANLRILSAVAKKLHVPLERVITTLENHGNTSAASVPLALDTAVRDGRIHHGDTVVLGAMGAGFTWGSALITY